MASLTYPFDSILINGRDVSLRSIISNSASITSAFENHTFDFIRQWLSDDHNFSITTSGSTGTPKTIWVTRSQMQASAKMTISFLGLTDKDVALVCLPTQFIAGRMMLVRAFETGMYIIAQEPSSNPFQNITAKIDFTALVPLQIQSIIEGGKNYVDQLNSMKAILVGGASISNTLSDEIKKITSPVYATYGMTETISHIALQQLSNYTEAENFVTLPNIQIQKDDRDCLVVEAPYLTNKIITNDIVNIISDREFQWLGRWDNIINSGGVKIIPEKIEVKISAVLNQLNIKANFFVKGIPDERLGQKIILMLETSNPINKDEMLVALKQSLSKYEVPKDIVTVSQFTYTNTGKINRLESMPIE